MNVRVMTAALSLALFWSATALTPKCRAADPSESAAANQADQLLLVTAPRMKDLATAWADTSLGRMIQGADMQPFRAELDKNDIGSLLRLRPWFGWDWTELAEVPGNVTFNIFPIPSAAAPAGANATAAPQPEFVCVLWKDKDDPAVAACRAAGEAYFSKRGVKPTTQKVGAVTCTVYTYKPKTGPARTTVYFGTDDFVAATTSIRGAELLLPRLQAGAAAFGIAGQEGLAQFAFQPLPLAKLIIKPPAKGKKNYVKFFERQGGGEIKLVRGSIDMPAQGALELSVNTELQGTFPLPKGLGVLNYQPSKAPDLSASFGHPGYTVRHWNWDFPVAMKSVANLFDEWNEPGPSGEGLFDDLVNGLRDDPEGPQVDLRKGLFNQLGPTIKEVVFAGDPTKSPVPEHKLMLIACKDAAAVKQTLDKYYKNDKKIGKTTLGGQMVWHVPPGRSLFLESQNKNAQSYEAAAVINDVLYLADNYEGFLRYLAAGPADEKIKAGLTAADQASLTVAGDMVGFRSLSLAEHAWRVPFENLKAAPSKNESGNAALLRWLLMGDEATRPADLGKTLPEWSMLQPLAPPTFNILNPDKAGMRWQSGMLRAP